MITADPYAVLGVTADARPDEVRAAWRRLATAYHPDRFVDDGPEVQERAAAKMTSVNAAFEEIRSGRAGRRVDAGRPPRWASDDDGRWSDLDDEDPVDAVLHRVARRSRDPFELSRRGKILAVTLVVVVVALLGHQALTRPYVYGHVWDASSSSYRPVDCGSLYDSGRGAADELRRDAASASDPEALYRQADAVEDLCGEWRRDLELLWVALVPLGAFGLWCLFGRRYAW